jgi:penicillin-binding protein 1A
VTSKIIKIPFLKWSFIGFFNTAAFVAGFFFFIFRHPIVDFSVLERYDPGKPSLLLDEKGKEWGRFQFDKRDPIGIKEMPPHLVHAFIAAEDWEFFNHCGLSWKGIARSALTNLYHGRIVQGASTITQQLIKLLYFDHARSFKRKFKEQFFTLLVERQFTKEQILETYLNHVYFGCGIYGVEAASQRFWNKGVQDLSVEQAATLAAVVCSPGNYCPLLYPLSSEHRRNVILGKMKRLSFISSDELTHSKTASLGLESVDSSNIAPHLKETLRRWLEEKFGKQRLYSGGLKIRTTLNPQLQVDAEKAFKKQFKYLRQKLGGDIEGALISIGRSTGEIKALVGGVDFSGSQFNRAFQAYRQQGSVFKPVLYAAALERGMSLLDTAIDEPLKVQAGGSLWEPRNHTRRFEGEMTLARALSYSNNIISAKTLLEIGVNNVIDCARRCRIKGTLNPYPSLALGCVDSTLFEVVGMFNVFANEGMYVEPHAIKWVKDEWGKKIYRPTYEKEQAISVRIASQIGQALTAGMERKRKTSKHWLDSAAMSKTGTTNDSRTCWFAGSTPELTTALYVGCDDNRPMGRDIYPVYTAYPVWLNLHKKVKTQTKKFVFDASLKPVFVDWKTGKILASQVNGDVHSLLI